MIINVMKNGTNIFRIIGIVIVRKIKAMMNKGVYKNKFSSHLLISQRADIR